LEELPESRAKESEVTQSVDLRRRRLYNSALLELDQELLPRRIRIAKIAIHSEIVKLHKADDAGGVWVLMDALNVLDDLLRMNKVNPPQKPYD
jgi:hypothetical protein